MYIVIAGGGKIGAYLAGVLLQSDNAVAVIEEDLDTADMLSEVLEGRYMVIHGDGCDSKYQEDAGALMYSLLLLDKTTIILFRAKSRSAYSTYRAVSRASTARRIFAFLKRLELSSFRQPLLLRI